MTYIHRWSSQRPNTCYYNHKNDNNSKIRNEEDGKSHYFLLSVSLSNFTLFDFSFFLLRNRLRGFRESEDASSESTPGQGQIPASSVNLCTGRCRTMACSNYTVNYLNRSTNGRKDRWCFFMQSTTALPSCIYVMFVSKFHRGWRFPCKDGRRRGEFLISSS